MRFCSDGPVYLSLMKAIYICINKIQFKNKHNVQKSFRLLKHISRGSWINVSFPVKENYNNWLSLTHACFWPSRKAIIFKIKYKMLRKFNSFEKFRLSVTKALSDRTVWTSLFPRADSPVHSCAAFSVRNARAFSSRTLAYFRPRNFGAWIFCSSYIVFCASLCCVPWAGLIV